MLDFMTVSREFKKNGFELYPTFNVGIRSQDLMIRGGDFYAIWDEENKRWSLDEYDAIRLIDKELNEYYKANKDTLGDSVRIKYMWDSDTGMIDKWHKFVQKQCRDKYHPLDENLIFSNTEVKKESYSTKKLNYPLQKGDTPAYDRMMSVLYSPEERHKIEWFIGSIVSGDSKKLQKFVVLYGDAGSGKSTVINLMQQLFEGYWSVFDAKALGSKNESFSLEPFANNPLLAIQHDGDLSHIEDNTRLNSIVSHEVMRINAKYQKTYESKFNTVLIMATNTPVRITDAKSGLLRRLIDVEPTGDRLETKEYNSIISRLKFELGGIAHHCLDVYLDNPGYYNDYKPVRMMGASNDFYNYILEQYDLFKTDNCTTLKSAWDSYKLYCEDAKIPYPLKKILFKEELKNYFANYTEKKVNEDGTTTNHLYEGFITDKFGTKPKPKAEKPHGFVFREQESLLDRELAKCHAQYANKSEVPGLPWDQVSTKLSDLDTSKLHYVRPPKNHIVIDFDLKDKDGNKSFKKNLEACRDWPLTYAELSKSGEGIHLHYLYDGDVEQLSRLYSEDIEIKVFTGKSSLRRKLIKCNDLPIATLNTGLPLKGENKVVNFDVIKSEKGLRRVIQKNLRKEIHPATKPSIDFIYKILEDAYASGMIYDISDMKPSVIAFASKSTHQADACLKLVSKMHFRSEFSSDSVKEYVNDDVVLFDIEIFPNLFVVVWMAVGKKPVILINPKKERIEDILKMKLVGFNCRRYDNHILYAAMMGYTPAQLYKLSQQIINEGKGFFGEAYNISYTDIYDYAAKKQSLKKWEIELGIHHLELGLPWDQPVPEELWEKVAEYCVNDVVATEAVWNATQGDFLAREMLAAISEASGVPACVNDTTNSLTTKIIFGRERKPNLVYTDLKTGINSNGVKSKEVVNEFPDYDYVSGLDSPDNHAHNMFRGEDVGFGGLVWAQPGMYWDVTTFDVASMHPHSIIAMNCFGEYTQRFKEIVEARVAIKHKDYETASTMLNGVLAPYLTDDKKAKQVAQALKIAINSVYGLTAASFENPFKDERNVNNIVALRGALFMATLRDEILARGYTVVGIKTDSIKIQHADKEITDYVIKRGKEYGYDFEIENHFEKICLVNNAVFSAKLAEDDPEDPGHWTATGTQFQVPYVFKTLFSHEELVFEDFCETKSVSKGEIYLDMNENLPEGEHNYIFVGRVGEFTPVQSGAGGGVLYRKQNDKYYAITGTKGYRWLLSEQVRLLDKQNSIDTSYYDHLVDEAIASINEFGDVSKFLND